MRVMQVPRPNPLVRRLRQWEAAVHQQTMRRYVSQFIKGEPCKHVAAWYAHRRDRAMEDSHA